MYRLKEDKFESSFKKSISFLSNREKINLYKKINIFLQKKVSTNNIKKLNLPNETLYCSYIKVDDDSFHSSVQQIIHYGILIKKEADGKEPFMFIVRDNKILSPFTLRDKIKFKLEEYTLEGFNEILSFIKSNIKFKFKEMYYYYNVKEEQKEIIKKEVENFNQTYSYHLLKSERNAKIFNSIALRVYDKSLLKTSGKIFGYKIKNIKELDSAKKLFGLDFIEDFYKKYPLLISLLIRTANSSSKKENEIASLFYKHCDENKKLPFVENIKNYFSLSDSQMKMIENKNWQKLTILKNRPIVLIDLIKFGLNLDEIKSRKEIYSIYIYYFYFYNNNQTTLPIKIDFNKIKSMNLTKDDYKSFKGFCQRMKKLSKLERFFIGNSTYKIKTDPFYVLTKIKVFTLQTKILKDSFVFKGINFIVLDNLKKIEIKSENFDFTLDLKILSNEEISFDITDNKKSIDSNEIKKEISEAIKLDFERLLNKRYPFLCLLNRRSIINHLHQYYPTKALKEKMFDFVITLSNKEYSRESHSSKNSSLFDNYVEILKLENFYKDKTYSEDLNISPYDLV